MVGMIDLPTHLEQSFYLSAVQYIDVFGFCVFESVDNIINLYRVLEWREIK